MTETLLGAGERRAEALSQFNRSRLARWMIWALASAAMMVLLLAPAIWNGFPLIFPDTGGYFTAPMVRALANGRSAFYGFFLDLGIPLAFWPSVIAQSALMIWLFVVTLRVNGLGARPWFALGVVTMLTVTTSLPWFAGQLMPDILFPAAALALYLLAYAHDRLLPGERWALAGVIAFAIASHMAAAAMCVAVIAALFVVSRIASLASYLALPPLRLKFCAGAIAAGIVLCPVSNLVLVGSFAFTPGGTTFLFGRLVHDGIIARYLDDVCPDATIRLCAEKNRLPKTAEGFLWDDSLIYELGGWKAHEPEQKRIIKDTLLRYPLVHIETAVKATLSQFVTFATEVEVNKNAPTFNSIGEHLPWLLPRLFAARQQSERFDVAPLNALHVPVAFLALAGMILALALRRRLNIAPQAAALCFVVLLALGANAMICGIFSHPVDRYQSRLVLLAPFVAAILVAQSRRSPVKA